MVVAMMLVPLPEPVLQFTARLRRSPLTWIVAAELGILLAVGYVTMHLLSTLPSRPPPNLGQTDSEPYSAQSPQGFFTPMPGATRSPRPGSSQPAPGLDRTRDPMRLPFELDTLNRDLAHWEAQQWALIGAVTKAVQDYLERVVLPAVLRAEEHMHTS